MGKFSLFPAFQVAQGYEKSLRNFAFSALSGENHPFIRSLSIAKHIRQARQIFTNHQLFLKIFS
jgi:hypothetical protein